MLKACRSLPAILMTATILIAARPAAIDRAQKTGPAPTPASSKSNLLVAAAADLRFAMDSLVAQFTRENPGIGIKVTYGSSGNFYEQIRNGAPFDLFFSADVDYPRQLKEQNKTLSEVHVYGTGQLVLWSKTVDPARQQMNTLLDPHVTKIAIANPAHAPYGKRAVESLHYYKLYDKVKDKLVIGENIAQTAQYAQTGAAEVGVIALSLAVSPTMKKTGGKYWIIPAAAHQPLSQGFVLLQHSKGSIAAGKFALFCGSGQAAATLKYFGFGKP
ncbi:MAG TPA: molybdate ABC transporter substrate-binding protein [Puia sp.]|nr:molybdate ABC transporter substrate-binding protein [Puia sp.]